VKVIPRMALNSCSRKEEEGGKLLLPFFRILALAYYKLKADILLPTVLKNFHFLSKEKC